MNKRGFTLIELLITVAIIGILAAVAVTAYVGTTKKAARSEAYTNLESLRLLEEQFFAEASIYSPDAANIVAIQVDLPGFQPGATSFTYAIINNNEITDNTGQTTATPPTFGVSATPCFVATAIGIGATRVEGDEFAIDCNNNRNF